MKVFDYMSMSQKKLEKLVRQGDFYASMQLAANYVRGFDCDVDYEKAYEILSKLKTFGEEEGLGHYLLGVVLNSPSFPDIYNPEEARTHMEKSASLGYRDACATLGIALMNGENGYPIDYAAAEKYLTIAKEKEYSLGYYYLACFYDDPSHGDYYNPDKAIRILKEAMGYCDPYSTCELGMIYVDGIPGVAPNRVKAEKYLKLAIQYGSGTAYSSLASLYLTQDDPDFYRPDEALRLLQEGKEQGMLECAKTLGEYYEYGLDGSQPDYQKAIAEYREVAEMGYPPACYALGRLLAREDDPHTYDPDGARKYIEWAAEKGYYEAVIDYALYQYNGSLGYEASAKKAAEILLPLAKAGDPYANFCLGTIYSDEAFPEMYDLERAYQHKLISAEAGMGEDPLLIGEAFLYGVNGLPLDPEKGIEYLREFGRVNRDPRPYAILSNFYEMPGEYKDAKKALKMLKKAAELGDQAAKEKLDSPRPIKNQA